MRRQVFLQTRKMAKAEHTRHDLCDLDIRWLRTVNQNRVALQNRHLFAPGESVVMAVLCIVGCL